VALNLKQLGLAWPEVTPVEKKALAHRAKPSSLKQELTGA
jgi:hypothetical protein